MGFTAADGLAVGIVRLQFAIVTIKQLSVVIVQVHAAA